MSRLEQAILFVGLGVLSLSTDESRAHVYAWVGLLFLCTGAFNLGQWINAQLKRYGES